MGLLALMGASAGCDFFGIPDENDDDTVRDWTEEAATVEVEVSYTTPVICDSPSGGGFDDVTDLAVPLYTLSNPAWDETANGYSSLDVELLGGFVLADLGGGGTSLVVTDADGPVRHFPELSVDALPSDGDDLSKLTGPGFVIGANAVDFDGDGDLDLLLLRHGPDLLLENQAGVFAPTGMLTGPEEARSISAAWADVDRDGDLDVYVVRHGAGAVLPTEWYPPDRDSLFLQQDDGTFIDAIDRVLAEEDDGYGYVAGWLDADGDGWLDLYIVNDLGAEPGSVPNIFLRGTGDPESPLARDPAVQLDRGMFGMGLAIADYDHDGDEDVHVTDAGGTFLARNDEGVFTDISLELAGLNDRPEADIAWATEWIDADNNGELELFTAFGHMASKVDRPPAEAANAVLQPDALWAPGSSGTWADLAPNVGLDDGGATRTAVSVDLDGNGFPELVTWRLDQGLRINRARCTGNTWLRVVLRDYTSRNPAGIGAMVEAGGEAGLITSRRVRAGAALTSGPPEVILGLGSASTVDLRVVWPDGEISESKAVPTTRTLFVERFDPGP